MQEAFLQQKKSELAIVLDEQSVDIFIIVEANITPETIKYYSIRNYQIQYMPKSRQIASGILIGVHKNLINKFTIIKTMDEDDRMEVIKIDVWKQENHFKIYGLYNPPNNVPNMEVLELSSKTVVVGDFNAHMKEVGYSDDNATGKAIKDYIDSNNIVLIYNSNDTPSYLHYNGSTTNPDLTLVSPDISIQTTRSILDDSGTGHRMIINSIQIGGKTGANTKTIPRYSWNFKKAKWDAYEQELETKLTSTTFQPGIRTPASNYKRYCKMILEAAKHHIPQRSMSTIQALLVRYPEST